MGAMPLKILIGTIKTMKVELLKCDAIYGIFLLL
jgi:hypothetical protein